MTDGIRNEPRPIPVPSLGEHALLLACLTAYGIHARRLNIASARQLASEAFNLHALEDWRGEKTLQRVLATVDRLAYRGKP